MLSKKTRLILKIVIAIMMAIATTIGVFIMYYIFADKENFPYFLNHFGLAIVLACIGVIAFILPLLGRKKYGDDTRDGVMIIAAGLLVLLGLLSIIMSYIGVGFYGNI